MAILMQRSAHTLARLSPYFISGILRPLPRSERGRFFLLMVAMESVSLAHHDVKGGCGGGEGVKCDIAHLRDCLRSPLSV